MEGVYMPVKCITTLSKRLRVSDEIDQQALAVKSASSCYLRDCLLRTTLQ